jgi:hypothetical protein
MTDRHAADSDAIRTAASRCCSSTIVIPAAHPSTAQRRRQSTTRATTSMSMSTTMTTTSRRIRALRGSAGSAERACPARRLSTLSARTVVVAIPSCLFWYVGCDALHQTLQIKTAYTNAYDASSAAAAAAAVARAVIVTAVALRASSLRAPLERWRFE